MEYSIEELILNYAKAHNLNSKDEIIKVTNELFDRILLSELDENLFNLFKAINETQSDENRIIFNKTAPNNVISIDRHLEKK